MGIDWTEKSPEHPINWERDWRELSQDGKHYVVYDAQLVALEDFLEDES